MSKIIKKFTRRVPKWKPRVKPIEQREATQEQIEALKITPSNTKISEYVLTLAHDVESLSIRSPLFNAIMYDEGGLSRSERELGAIAASMVNHCIYCAAVHADRHAKLEKNTDVTDELFKNGIKANLSERDKAIFNFAYKLSETPPTTTAEEIFELRNQELDDLEIIDLVFSSALFGWANRLMHVLGDPVSPELEK